MKKNKTNYLITSSWVIESDQDLELDLEKNEQTFLEILQHRISGTVSFSACPARNQASHSIVKDKDLLTIKPVDITAGWIQR